MSDNSQILPCVMVPVTGRQLLLPNVSIAEVVDYASTNTAGGDRPWLLGWLDWRGRNLPVISYDAANGQTPAIPTGSRGRVIVLNTIGEHHQQLPFLALVTQGIPSQARLSAEQLSEIAGDTGPADLMLVDIEGDNAFIPNLEYLESLALEAIR